jgi:hypothetical protein
MILSKRWDDVRPRERLFSYSLVLEEYDRRLECVRSWRVFERSTTSGSWVRDMGRRLAVDAAGTSWLADRFGATGYRTTGETDRIDAPLPEDLEVATLTFVEDDFLFLCHRIEPPDGAPAALCVSRGGTRRWLTSLPMETRDQALVRRYRRSEPLWICDLSGPEVVVSKDAALATFVDGAGLGRCHAVSLSDGAIRFTTDRGPVTTAAALDDGEFLVARQGYGITPITTRYSARGRASCEWLGCGAFAIHDRDLRMIEFAALKDSPKRLVSLQPDGTIVKGDALSDAAFISAPQLAHDGRLFVLHGA